MEDNDPTTLRDAIFNLSTENEGQTAIMLGLVRIGDILEQMEDTILKAISLLERHTNRP